MRIALINENSQAAKNSIIEKSLRKVVEPMGFEVRNYGMYAADDEAQLTYVQNGILAATLLNAGACDYVITGCGTGEGAMLALNSFPGVICGHVATPLDAYTFATFLRALRRRISQGESSTGAEKQEDPRPGQACHL